MRKFFILSISGYLLLNFGISVFASEFQRQKMREIYNRIRAHLLSEEKKKFLNNRHVLKVTLFKKDASGTEGLIRLNTKDVKCIQLSSNGASHATIILQIDNLKRAEILRWSKRASKRIQNYTVYYFSPNVVKVITKDNKEFFVSPESLSLFSNYYLFKQDGEPERVLTEFVLYFDNAKGIFYNTNMHRDFHENNPVKNTVYAIDINGYFYDNNVQSNVANNSPYVDNQPDTLQMRQSESQAYFEQQRQARIAELKRQEELRKQEAERQARLEQNAREAQARNAQRRGNNRR